MPKLNDLFIPDRILVDGMNLSKRYHHALCLMDSNNIPMGCPYGVLKYVHTLKSKYPKSKIVFLWEGKTSFRKTLYPEYKAKRRKSSDDPFYTSLVVLKTALSYYGIKQVYHPGMEADDLAGYYCNLYKDYNVLMLSNDYDWFQYVLDNARLQMKDSVILDAESARDKLGFISKNIPIFKALTGDSSDNIKGVSHFPKKLAIHLCSLVHNLNDLKDPAFYMLAHDLLSEKVIKKWYDEVCAQWKHIKFVYELMCYNPELIDPVKIRALKIHESISALKSLLLKHNMNNLVNIFKD